MWSFLTYFLIIVFLLIHIQVGLHTAYSVVDSDFFINKNKFIRTILVILFIILGFVGFAIMSITSYIAELIIEVIKK
jgi:hypothetical protein